MAGMLPGVESARRRRLSGWCDPSSVISSGFGSARIRLSKDIPRLTPTSFLVVNQLDDEDDKLGGAAREAKQRLDGRLRGHFKKQISKSRENSQERSSSVGRRSTTTTPIVMENSQIEIFGNGIKRRLRMGWSWKSSSKQDDECAICLDQFKTSEKKIPHLPCAHRFHSDCLLPWLENNAHCPCCRANVLVSN